MVFTIKLVDVKDVTALELEQIGRGYNKLHKHRDYVIDKDETTLFINIKMKLKGGEDYHLKIETLQQDGSTVEWLVLFTSKGLFSLIRFCNFISTTFISQRMIKMMFL